MPRFHVPFVAAAAAAVLLAAAAVAEPPPANERLATQLARSGSLLLDDARRPTMDIIRMAAVLAEQAALLAPDDPSLWRTLVDVARLAERDDLYRRGLEGLTRADPADDTARLRRLAAAIEQHQTVEARRAALEGLLGEGPQRLGVAVASRLWLDLALLEQRAGNIERFADDLARAIEIDPSNRAAAALAAGYFRLHVDDPVGEAELLTTLMLADPTDLTAMIALGECMLEGGAYVGAARLYDLVVRNHAVARRVPAAALLADQAIAQWAAGDVGAALRTIRDQQQRADDRARAAAREEEPELDPVERSRLSGAVDPILATVRAAIHVEADHELAADSVERAMQSYQVAIDLARGADDARAAARVGLEMAWVAIWLGANGQTTRELLETVEEIEPLTDDARARFAGWIALQQGDRAEARRRLAPLAASDPAARLGLAELERRDGNQRTAARLFLEISRAQPGTVLGIWSAHRVSELVRQRVPMSDTASRLEALVRSIPPVFFEYPRATNLAVDFRAEFSRTVYQPGEPVILNIKVTNTSPFPLAIDRDGPLRPHVIVFPQTTIERPGAGQREIPPMVVDIGHRLRLEPGEQLVVPVDLRRYHLGRALERNPLSGTFIRVKVILNGFGTVQAAIVPGVLGQEMWTPSVRVEGVRLTAEWLQNAIQTVAESDPDDPEALEPLAMLARVLALRPPSADAPGEEQRLLREVGDVLVERYPELDEAGRAWLLGTVPAGRLPAPVLAMARKSDSELVRLSFLVFQLTGVDDPMIEAALRSSSEPLRIVAEQYVSTFERLAEVLGTRREAPPSPDGRP